MRTPWLSILSVFVAFSGLAWSLGSVLPLLYALRHRRLPVVGPIQLLAGPFEALGMDAFFAAGLVFVVVSALRLLAAYWLWQARLDGAVLDLILVGLSAIFWYGFALPFGPVGGLAEVVLLALVWGTLH